MVRASHAGGTNPAALTLAEAIADQPWIPSLLWGRHLGSLVPGPGESGGDFALLPDVRSAAGLRLEHEVGMLPPPSRAFSRVLSDLPRSKEELSWRVAVAAAVLAPGQQLWLAGHQREGIKGAAKTLAAGLGPVGVAHTKRHTRVLVATRDARVAAAPTLDTVEEAFVARFGIRDVACRSLPGTFSHGRLDGGTERLLAFLADDRERRKRVLDLGAGCGVLGASLALLSHTRKVTLVESSYAGVESSRRTLLANGLVSKEQAEAVLADVGEAPRGPFDLIVTNPPFHDGRDQDRQLLGHFADAASHRLARGGRFLVVANRHLGYHDDLAARFRHVEVAWEDTRFRIWSCAGAGKGDRG